jgi:hypothetical protein
MTVWVAVAIFLCPAFPEHRPNETVGCVVGGLALCLRRWSGRLGVAWLNEAAFVGEDDGLCSVA